MNENQHDAILALSQTAITAHNVLIAFVLLFFGFTAGVLVTGLVGERAARCHDRDEQSIWEAQGRKRCPGCGEKTYDRLAYYANAEYLIDAGWTRVPETPFWEHDIYSRKFGVTTEEAMARQREVAERGLK